MKETEKGKLMEVKNTADVEIDGLVSNKEVNKHEGTEMPESIRNTLAQIMETYHSKLLNTTSVVGVACSFIGLMMIIGSLLAISDHRSVAIALIIFGFVLLVFGFLHKKTNVSADIIRKGDFVYFISTVNQIKTPTASTKVVYTVEDIKTIPLLDSDADTIKEGSQILCIYTGKGILCTDIEYHNIKEYEKVNGRSNDEKNITMTTYNEKEDIQSDENDEQ